MLYILRRLSFILIAIICNAFFITETKADEKQELLEIKNTTLNLIEALVEEGLLSKEKARTLIKKAEAKAAMEAKQAAATNPVAAVAETAEAGAEDTAQKSGVIRVPYVPQIVRDEIRQQVKAELREDVLADVKQTAKQEKWGTPDALPGWVSRVKFFGDMRVRSANIFYGPDNIPNSYLNFNAINAAGGIIPAGRDAFLDTTADRYFAQIRARLGMNITVTDNLMAGFRVTTGDLRNPVSTNQFLGNYGGRYQIDLDWAYLQYDHYTSDHFKWLTLQAGRMPNPWLFTNLVWDDDLSFEGLIAQFRADLGSDDSLYAMDESGRTFFLTTGITPLQGAGQLNQFDFIDKWLLGGQTGLEWTFENQSNAKLGVAYYYYKNVEGVRNTFNSTAENKTAPLFVQKGNSMFDINNDNDPTTNLFALASKFHILNITGRYDYAGFAPIHVIATADYARNFGFNQNEVLNRTGILFAPRVNAWQAILQVGWPKIRKWADWNLFLAYKYLERNAVLDAFTDSNFHFGGTDAKGFIVGGRFGLTYHTALQLRWFSANQIDGPPLGIDSLLLDLTADL
ncbi:MAG: putative porin [Methylococcales bacterium]